MAPAGKSKSRRSEAAASRSPREPRAGPTQRRHSLRLASKAADPEAKPIHRKAKSERIGVDGEETKKKGSIRVASLVPDDSEHQLSADCEEGRAKPFTSHEIIIRQTAGGPEGGQKDCNTGSSRSTSGRRWWTASLVVTVCGCLLGLAAGADKLPALHRELDFEPNASQREKQSPDLSASVAQIATSTGPSVKRVRDVGLHLMQKAMGLAQKIPIPAFCLGGAPIAATLMGWLRAPKIFGWTIGGSLVVLASIIAGREGWLVHPGSSRSAGHAATIAVLDSTRLSAVLGGGASLSVVDSWLSAWQASIVEDDSFAAAKLVVQSNAQQTGETNGDQHGLEELLHIFRALVPPTAFLELSARGCSPMGSGDESAASAEGTPSTLGVNCITRLERHLVRMSDASLPALVIVRDLEKCVNDSCFDSLLGTLERFIDPNVRQPILTASGVVRANLAAFVLTASHLTADECAELQGLGVAEMQAQIASNMENLWPASGFSTDVSIARRALINRLGRNSGAVVCAPSS
mmetsp:Transcript_27117/g.82178  ORF Transcript_27117/g.82178 Transcript_27117/m.82178 type:complete len:521 (+) Transcript_27117:79-1641(+)